MRPPAEAAEPRTGPRSASHADPPRRDRRRSLHRWGWAWAVLGPPLALGVRLLLGSHLHGYPFVLFIPVVLVATYGGGWVAGALAGAWSLLLSTRFLVGADYQFQPLEPGNLVGVVFFSAIIAALIVFMHLLQRANRMLEERVAQRTAELARINEQLRAEIAMREDAEAQVRHAQKMEAIGKLTGGIAHDFNNMLAIVGGSLSLVRRRLAKGDADVSEHLAAAQGGVDRAAALTRRLLAFARRQPLTRVSVDVNRQLREMDTLVERAVGERVELRWQLGRGGWHVLMDPGEFEQAIINLAVNARDAMSDGGVVTIRTGLRSGAPLAGPGLAAAADRIDYVVVELEDTGMGMPTEVAAQAFDPFFTTKQAGEGSGLGLSQVYGFVTQSGGQVAIDSRPGRGTTVTLRLPCQPAAAVVWGADDRRRQADQDRAAGEECPAGMANEVVLVVEDEPPVRAVVVSTLQDLGYSVRQAGSANEALDILAVDSRVELLFTDVMMPGMNGRQLAEAALQLRPDLDVLFTSGHTYGIDTRLPSGRAHRGLLMKPYGAHQLAEAVRDVFDDRRSLRPSTRDA